MSSATGSPLRRVVRNFLTLLGGRAAGGVLAFLATVLSARLLGPAGFGIVALVHAYVMIVRGLVNIKPFEAIVRFGVPLLDDRRHAELGRLLRACLLIDLCSAAGGAAVAAAGVPLMAALGVWDATANPVALAYALALLCSGQATASGVLRIFDRFDAISGALVIANGARLLGVVLVGVIFDGGIFAIAMVWAGSLALRFLLVQWFGWRVVRVHLPAAALRGPVELAAVGEAHPGIWRFLHVVYWQSTLELVHKPVGTLLAGGLLGAEAAALFRIARETANVVSKPALLARQAIYPDLTRLHHGGNHGFSRVVIAISLMLALPAAVLVLLVASFGEEIIGLTAGPEYVGAAGVMTWLAAAAVLEVAAAPLRPAAFALGRAGTGLVVQAAAAATYLGTFAALAPTLGLVTPGIAGVAFGTIVLVGFGLLVRRALSVARPAAP